MFFFYANQSGEEGGGEHPVQTLVEHVSLLSAYKERWWGGGGGLGDWEKLTFSTKHPMNTT